MRDSLGPNKGKENDKKSDKNLFQSFNSKEHLSTGKKYSDNPLFKQAADSNAANQEENRDLSINFDHLHPRMMYEVMNLLKQKGSVNSHDLVDIVEKFEDVNTKENVSKLQDSDYKKYAQYSLEAMQDTIKNHQESKYG